MIHEEICFITGKNGKPQTTTGWLIACYGARLHLWTVATNGHIAHPPDDMSLESAGGMIYWQGKTEELGEKAVPVPLCAP
jgi:hypothetical protein